MSESLRDWESPPVIHEEKQPMYRSKHNPDVKLVKSSFGNHSVVDEYPESKSKRKPSLPDFKNVPAHGLSSPKNAVASNAIEAILSKPPPRKPEPVRYVNKDDYGKVPDYLKNVKAQIRNEKEMRNQANAQENTANQEDSSEWELAPEERQELLDKLQAKWNQYNQEYQTLTHMVITTGSAKARKKAELEDKLNSVERAMKDLQVKRIVITK